MRNRILKQGDRVDPTVMHAINNAKTMNQVNMVKAIYRLEGRTGDIAEKVGIDDGRGGGSGTGGSGGTGTGGSGGTGGGTSGGSGSVDLSNYYTKSETYSRKEVDAKIEGVVAGEVDLSDYVTDAELQQTAQDLTNLMTVNLGNFYPKTETYSRQETCSKKEIEDLIAQGGEGGGTDLTNYYTKEEVNGKLKGYYDKANPVKMGEGGGNGRGMFVAVASEGDTNRNAYSEDGITWKNGNSLDTSSTWQSVCYGNGMVLTVTLTQLMA